MKKIISILLSLSASSLIISGCATSTPEGSAYTGIVTPIQGGANKVAVTKTGKACSHSYLGLIATDDASTAKAIENGHITNVASVNYTTFNILGVYGSYCTEVAGN